MATKGTPITLKKFYIVFNRHTEHVGYYTVVEATWQGDAEIYAQTYWPSNCYRIFSSGGFWQHKNTQLGRSLKQLPKEAA